MFKIACVGVCGLALLACATQDVLPPNFSGPAARVSDSSYIYSTHKADFFYAAEIDGKPVTNALDDTIRSNAGRGLSQTVRGAERRVEAKPTTFHIVGESHYAAPIWALKGENYRVEGDVGFVPVADQVYVVKGSLGPDFCAVWMENLATGVQVGNKLMIKGDASLNRGSTLLLGNVGAKSARKPEEIPPPVQ